MAGFVQYVPVNVTNDALPLVPYDAAAVRLANLPHLRAWYDSGRAFVVARDDGRVDLRDRANRHTLRSRSTARPAQTEAINAGATLTFDGSQAFEGVAGFQLSPTAYTIAHVIRLTGSGLRYLHGPATTGTGGDVVAALGFSDGVARLLNGTGGSSVLIAGSTDHRNTVAVLAETFSTARGRRIVHNGVVAATLGGAQPALTIGTFSLGQFGTTTAARFLGDHRMTVVFDADYTDPELAPHAAWLWARLKAIGGIA